MLDCVHAGATTTRFLESLPFKPKAIEVVSPGMNTTVQVCFMSSSHAHSPILQLAMQVPKSCPFLAAVNVIPADPT